MRVVIGFLALAFVVLQVQLWSPDGGLIGVWQLRAAVEETRAANAELRQRNRALEADVMDLKDGLEALEERARSELGMIREGEVFYQVAE